jgi:hypothetical protein
MLKQLEEIIKKLAELARDNIFHKANNENDENGRLRQLEVIIKEQWLKQLKEIIKEQRLKQLEEIIKEQAILASKYKEHF